MGRRRSKSRKRRDRGAEPARPEAAPRRTPAAEAAEPGTEPPTARPATRPSPPKASSPKATPAEAPGPERAALRPWRPRVQALLDHLQSWGRTQYAAAIERWLEHTFEPLGGADAARACDVDRAVEDFLCLPGSAGEGLSVLRVFADQAPAPEGGPMDPEDRDQIRRWERERGRGVFLVQHAAPDRLTLWDPLEGAPLTLHLLHKLGAARAAGIQRGTVVTATYQPWMARLVAVGEVEFFDDERAVSLFREETVSSGARWHEAPPPAPTPTARSRK